MLNFPPTQSSKRVHHSLCFTSYLPLLHPLSNGAVFRTEAPVKFTLLQVKEVFDITVVSPQLAGKTASECATCRNTTTFHDALGRDLQKNLLFLKL
ncbi:hypothetical protein [Rivularia sp. UHCC 0363]|uniref:hypothetical protein n=1 Tax=Rivularia sp. UHCC 0363 TaxID=3110244 RepID=UPI002B1EC80A|nr:hypothetical protein [Rivularia sp. UHCC 0363]MEA5595860.1 hypothetical protein [Rivularia sp. UHCC 0363]